jgi:F-type H+-transporting ATPase subunit b
VKLRALCLGLALLVGPTLGSAQAEDHSPSAGHGGLSLRQILFADLGEGASEEAQAEAKHETLSFWGSVVNFSLLVFLLVRMSKKPLDGFLAERRRAVEQGIVEAAAMKAKAEAVWKEYSERMQTLDAELSKLRADMAAAAQQDKARIVAEAEESAKRLHAETTAMVARQTEQLQAQIRREVVEAAVAAAERAVREATSADDQRRLSEAFIKELAKTGVEKRA